MNEGLPKAVAKPEKEKVETIEQEAERLLAQLLDDPNNIFLTEIPANKKYIDDAPTAVEALAFALQKIKARLERTAQLMIVSSEVIGVEVLDVDHVALAENVEEILKHAQEIGRGGDGVVVIDKSEVRELPPEICYKFALAEATPRGRNTTAQEMKTQELFYKAMAENPNSRIGIPIPFYALEIGHHKVIAMEKLNARSIDDILKGNGTLPDWFDLDALFAELNDALNYLHAKGLYHRDMHLGNVMISQKRVLSEGDKMAYIIDFGLSCEDETGLEPYKKEIAGTTFTYDNDYGIIVKGRSALKAFQKRGV